MTPDTLASTVLSAFQNGEQVTPFSAADSSLDAAKAYATADALNQLRLARGEKPVGRKIGFTNRAIWPEYGVSEPLWGYVYDSTFAAIAAGGLAKASDLVEPRIEPEIVLGLARDLEPGMDLAAVAASIGWVAHGFEIVQSIFPGWSFTIPDAIAGGGLHGRLFIGPKRTLAELGIADPAGLAQALAELRVTLSRDGEEMDGGRGANVLDGPVHALSHLLAVVSAGKQPPLRAGELITTGTMTRAFPIKAGERWSTKIEGVDLPGLDVKIV